MMKKIFVFGIMCFLFSCNNEAATSPNNSDNTKNNDTAAIKSDSTIHQQINVPDSMIKDSSKTKVK